ncbi:MAG TPA: class I tRNA ligase family protein, partial [Wenzhouxiangella sp.]
DAYRRIRNTARFLLGNLADFDPQAHSMPAADLLPLDRYAVGLASELQDQITDAYANYRFPLIYQKLHHFCSSDMGSFYLDIIKDRLYTLPKDHPARRSAQTAMMHILEALVRWLSPICPFTAEEIWGSMPGERGEFVAMETWYEPLASSQMAADPVAQAMWHRIRGVREAIGPELERLRREGAIGSSLASEVVLDASGSLAEDLAKVGDELRFILLTADVRLGEVTQPDLVTEVEGHALKAALIASQADKCTRCWHHSTTVGSNDQHPELCARCVTNVDGAGEVRRWG